MAAIDMKNIVKQYGDGFPAVNDVSIDVADGEFMILVGPSGCGKSTLLRMIVGLEDITSGDMLIDGKRVNDLAPRDRNLAMVFQNYALYPHLSVFENIAFPLRLARKLPEKEIEEKVRERQPAARARRAPRPQARQPLRRPAPAGGDGPGDRAGGRRVPLRRAALEPRRQAARPDAHRDLAAPEAARHHHGLRHPRPDRGDDPRRPGGRAQARHPAAAGHAAGALHQPRQPVRGRLHRLAADELPAAPRSRGRRSSCRSGPWSCRRRRRRRRPGKGLLMAGIRPEHFEDASVEAGHLRRRHLPRDRGRRGVARQRGLRLHPVRRTAGGAQPSSPSSRGTSTARPCTPSWWSPWTAASRIAEGDEAEIWMDVSKIHLFDPATGENLTVDRERAGRIPETPVESAAG